LPYVTNIAIKVTDTFSEYAGLIAKEDTLIMGLPVTKEFSAGTSNTVTFLNL